MTVMLVGKPLYPEAANYRGTERSRPYFNSMFEADHPVNRAFLDYVEMSNEAGEVSDHKSAKQLLEVFNMYSPDHNFELIRISTPNATVQGEYLGLDIVHNNYLSHLSNGLRTCLPHQESDVTHTLLCLFEAHFKPKLNNHGLFNDIESAQFCFDCIKALNTLEGELFDNPLIYKIVQIELII
jgi:hypothetical protein